LEQLLTTDVHFIFNDFLPVDPAPFLECCLVYRFAEKHIVIFILSVIFCPRVCYLFVFEVDCYARYRCQNALNNFRLHVAFIPFASEISTFTAFFAAHSVPYFHFRCHCKLACQRAFIASAYISICVDCRYVRDIAVSEDCLECSVCFCVRLMLIVVRAIAFKRVSY
jgi:hypothetical protein